MADCHNQAARGNAVSASHSTLATGAMQAMSPSNAAQHAGAAQGEQQPPKVAALDPQNSPRLYYEDPVTRVKREVWRPGDVDGDSKSDFYDRPGPPLPLSPSREPYVNEKNEPPHYVFLDDRTAHAVVESNITKFRKGLFWPHDFTEMGTIRARRVHRGNAAMTHPEKSGEEKFGHVMVGHKKAEKAKYVFHGEKRWREIIYKGLENANGDKEGSVTCSTSSPKTTNDRSQPSGHDKNGKEKHSHNQFTPRGELKAKPETGMINRFLRKRARSPQLPEPRKVRQILGGQKFRSGSPNTSERGPSVEVHEASPAFGSSPPVQASGPDATTKDNVIAHLREQLAAADEVIAANTLEMAKLRERLEEQRAQLEQNGKDMEGLLDLLKEVPEYAERMAASDEDAGDVAGAGVAEGGGMSAEQAGMGGAMGGGVDARGGHGEGEFGGDF